MASRAGVAGDRDNDSPPGGQDHVGPCGRIGDRAAHRRGQRQRGGRAPSNRRRAGPGRGQGEYHRRPPGLGRRPKRPARRRDHQKQRRTSQGQAARRHHGHLGARRLPVQPGPHQQGAGPGLGVQRRRPARQRHDDQHRPPGQRQDPQGRQGDRGPGGLRLRPGPDQHRAGARLGQQCLRATGERHRARQARAGLRQAAVRHQGDRDHRRKLPQRGRHRRRARVRLGLRRGRRAWQRQHR